MFFGESSEKGKEEVEIKDVVYDESVDLLKIITPGFSVQSDFLLHIRKLGEKFEMKVDMPETRNTYATPTIYSNVVLIVEGKKLHLNKDYLSTHSPVFSDLFFGEFSEKGKEEFELEGVVYEEFLDILNVIHPDLTAIRADSVAHILKLADQFQIKDQFLKDALSSCELFLIGTSKMEMTEKLILADKYNLKDYTDHILSSYSCAFHMQDLESSFEKLSDKMKLAIKERMKELVFANDGEHLNGGVCWCGFSADEDMDEEYIFDEDKSDDYWSSDEDDSSDSDENMAVEVSSDGDNN